MNSPIMKRTGLCLTAVAGVVFISFSGPAKADAPDLDGDGIPNIVDPDVDNDGIPNALDKNIDGGIAKSGPYAGKYIGDHLDNDNPAEKDIDGDTLADDSLGETDIDGDGLADDDPLETDTDGDGRLNDDPSERDMDGDGRLNDDDDEDDQDGDGDDDRFDSDDDNDGVADEDDLDHHPESDEMEVEQDLTPSAGAPAESEAKVEVQRLGTGKSVLKVKGQGLPAGSYDIVIGGAVRGPLVLSGSGNEAEGETEFESDPNEPGELLLDFTAFGEAISLQQGAVVFFSGTIPNPPPPAGGGEGSGEDPGPHPASIALTSAGNLPPAASASLEAEFGLLGPSGLEVQLEDVPAGDYDVLIDGVARATVVVAGTGGQVVFAAEPSGGEVALDFLAAGKPVSIAQGGVEFFAGVIPETAGN